MTTTEMLFFADNGDEHWPADMMRMGYDHLGLTAHGTGENGYPLVTMSEYRRWTAANGHNDRNGAYYPDGIAELVPFRGRAVMVMSNPDLGDEILTWLTTGDTTANGEYLYELTNAGEWVAV